MMHDDETFGEFKRFERAGWHAVAVKYDTAFGVATRQAIGAVLEAVEAGPGVRMLDVGCGPGDLVGAAAAKGAEVEGVDFAPEMVALAGRKWPGLAFGVGDAEEMESVDGAFDAVTMNFCVLHLADPDRAIGEAARVLKKGGRFAFTVWEPPPATVPFEIVLDAVQTHGVMGVGAPPGPPMFRFAERAEAEKVLHRAGFAGVGFAALPIVLTLQEPDALFVAMQEAGVRTAGLLRAQTPEAIDRMRAHVRERVEAFGVGEGSARLWVLPMPAVLVSAVRA